MISVIIPMYNAKDTIKSAIKSVLNQTYIEPIEIIIVNDESQDGCEKIVEDLIANNQTNRTIKLINKKNGGAASARNLGIKQASGDWIAFLDSDDQWINEKTTLQMDAIQKNPKINFIGTNTNVHYYKYLGKSKNTIYTLSAKEVLLQWFPQTSTILVKKEMLVEINYYDERRYGEDGDLNLKCAMNNNLYVLNMVLVNYDNGKSGFGISGMTSKLYDMYMGELTSLKDARIRRQINLVEYLLFHCWLTLKYYRRILIVKSSK